MHKKSICIDSKNPNLLLIEDTWQTAEQEKLGYPGQSIEPLLFKEVTNYNSMILN
jgi:hypothetical protein